MLVQFLSIFATFAIGVLAGITHAVRIPRWVKAALYVVSGTLVGLCAIFAELQYFQIHPHTLLSAFTIGREVATGAAVFLGFILGAVLVHLARKSERP